MAELENLLSGTDIRGTSDRLGEHEAYLIGYAFGMSLGDKKTIALGRDCRLNGVLLSKAFSAGARRSGAKLIDCGLATTPALFMAQVLSDAPHINASVMITASHLPKNWNGIKLFRKSGALEKNDVKKILNAAESYKGSLPPYLADKEDDKTESSPNSFDLMTLYKSHLKKAIARDLTGTHIVLDAGNGCGGFFAEILSSLGADTSGSQFLSPDGTFPNHIPNPEDKNAMESIKNAVLKNHADLGLIFDTDVDRMSCVLSDGKEVNRDAIIALAAAILAPKNPGAIIVTDSVTSNRLSRFLEGLSLEQFRYKRGYKNVIDKMNEINSAGGNCPLAIETSGHGALKENYSLDDGAYLACKIVAALADCKSHNKSLSSLIESLDPLVEELVARLTIKERDFANYGKKVLSSFERQAKEKSYTIIKGFEGVRLEFDGSASSPKGWILLRMSLHEAVLPLNIESERAGDLKRLKEIAKSLLIDFTSLDLSPLEDL